VQQRSKFPSPKNLLSLKYPKRGMSLWLQFQETRYQWTLLLSIQRWWCPLAVLEENQKFLLIGRTFSLVPYFGWGESSLHVSLFNVMLFGGFSNCLDEKCRVSFSVWPFQ
jgi:hypothetical protein